MHLKMGRTRKSNANKCGEMGHFTGKVTISPILSFTFPTRILGTSRAPAKGNMCPAPLRKIMRPCPNLDRRPSRTSTGCAECGHMPAQAVSFLIRAKVLHENVNMSRLNTCIRLHYIRPANPPSLHFFLITDQFKL